MNLKDNKYAQFYLVREMMDTVEAIRKFDPEVAAPVAESAAKTGHLLLSGEGSSRIMPAKNAIRKAMTWGIDQFVHTDGAHQSCEYALDNYTVVLASNSGRTKETLMLAKQLAAAGNERRFAVTANENTPLEEACNYTYVLRCGWENAVAATKSVVEQVLFNEAIVRKLAGKSFDTAALADKVEKALTLEVPAHIVEWVKGANTIYFAGMNDGVAEELTLKTNEITRRKSDFLEGTYALHGPEEVMQDGDIVFVVEPIESEYEKYQKVFGGANVHVVAIAPKQTPFDTVVVPDAGDLQQYVDLCAGWNILVEIGVALGINLDKPSRARKVGNEM
ncbi:MAG: SIS domain-containing protein [Bacteroidales bacterium]|nr:SIS domain-containing protein [Candidatus Cryptobacteroides aphodequi]